MVIVEDLARIGISALPTLYIRVSTHIILKKTLTLLYSLQSFLSRPRDTVATATSEVSSKMEVTMLPETQKMFEPVRRELNPHSSSHLVEILIAIITLVADPIRSGALSRRASIVITRPDESVHRNHTHQRQRNREWHPMALYKRSLHTYFALTRRNQIHQARPGADSHTLHQCRRPRVTKSPARFNARGSHDVGCCASKPNGRTEKNSSKTRDTVICRCGL